MSGNAYPRLQKWATLETVYPAGPFSGLPITILPAADYATPNAPFGAQQWNSVEQGWGTNDQSIIDATSMVLNQNFSAGALNALLNNVTTFTCAAYDSVNDLFILGALNTGTHASGFVLAERGDSFDPFAQPGTVAGPLGMIGSSMSSITSVLKDPSDSVTYYIAGIIVGGGAGVWRVTVPAPIGSAITVTQIQNIGGVTWSDVQLAYLNGYLIVANGSVSSPASSFIWSSNNQGASWGTTTVVNATTWTVATNGSQYVAVGNTPSGQSPVEVVSSNGSSFTVLGASLSGIPAVNSNVSGLTWGSDSNGSAWFFAYQDGTTTKLRWLRSTDGITWTLTTAQLSSLNWTPLPHALSSVGGLLVNLGWDSNGNIRVLYSKDGANTWLLAPFRTPKSGLSVGMAAGPNRLLGFVGASPLVSQAQGLSGLVAT